MKKILVCLTVMFLALIGSSNTYARDFMYYHDIGDDKMLTYEEAVENNLSGVAMLTVKSINLEKKTIKIVFNNNFDAMFRTDSKIIIGELGVLGAINNHQAVRVNTVGVDESFSKVGLIFQTNGIEPFTEIEIGYGDEDMIYDGNANIFWYLTSPNAGFSFGFFDFSSCMNNPDYKNGMTCDIRYTRRGYEYVPVLNNVENEEKIDKKDNEIEENSQNATKNIVETPVKEVETNTNNEEKIDRKVENIGNNVENNSKNVENSEKNDENDYLEVPLVGETCEMDWLKILLYFGLIIAVAVAIMAFFAIKKPIFQKKSKKV